MKLEKIKQRPITKEAIEEFKKSAYYRLFKTRFKTDGQIKAYLEEKKEFFKGSYVLTK